MEAVGPAVRDVVPGDHVALSAIPCGSLLTYRWSWSGRQIHPGGFDYVLEITARPQMLALAVELLAPMGVAALLGGAPAGTTAAINMHSLLAGGRTLRGIVQGDSVPRLFIPKLEELYRAGRFPIDRLVRTYALADINQAFADSARGTVVKPVLVMGG